MKKRLFIGVLVTLILVVACGVFLYFISINKIQQSNNLQNVASLQNIVVGIEDNKDLSTDTEITDEPPHWPIILDYNQAESVKVVVNKKHALPKDYIPKDLVSYFGVQMKSDVADALAAMANDAAKNNISITVASAYRSYYDQINTYSKYSTLETTTSRAALPGHSEHQTGLAIDIVTNAYSCNDYCTSEIADQWIARNSYLYGFIVRYPKNKESITGYQYEPWHLRYLGHDIAKTVYFSGKTVDEFFNVPAGDYK